MGSNLFKFLVILLFGGAIVLIASNDLAQKYYSSRGNQFSKSGQEFIRGLQGEQPLNDALRGTSPLNSNDSDYSSARAEPKWRVLDSVGKYWQSFTDILPSGRTDRGRNNSAIPSLSKGSAYSPQNPDVQHDALDSSDQQELNSLINSLE